MTSIRFTDLELQRPARGGSGFHLGPLSLELPSGTRTALVGPSGCGKTTLLRLLAGLQTATAGQVWLDDQLATEGSVLLTPPQARGVGFVFQDGGLWPHLDATAHLRFADPQLTRDDAVAALARVGLQGKERRKPGELSGGERQRLALARALVGAPRLLLLDEPLHSVDVHLRAELAMLIRGLAEERGLTLVLVTHDRHEALAVADHVVVLREGQLVEEGAASALLQHPRTAFAASFLAGATCLPCTRNGDGTVETPFGAFACAGDAAVQLAVLPADAAISDTGPAVGRVLQIVPAAGGLVATVQVGAMTVQVVADSALRPGAEVRLALRGQPRLLPESL
ncbi:MAG: ABC transporter ATP-binding protein [Planctomycetes bacterium]|nr:ABC transporter ATP-binding protein [Planctomycetota bacterium]